MPLGYDSRGKPEISWWQQEIEAGIKERDRLLHRDSWSTWVNMYRGNWKPNMMPLNLYFMMARTIIPKVYFRNPSVSVTPSKPNPLNAALAMVVQRMDNKLLQSMRMKQYMKRMAQWTWFYGTSGMKVGFGSEFIGTPSQISESAPGAINKRSLQYRTEYRENVQAQMPFCLPMHTGDMVLPAGAREPEETRWRAHLIRRPLYDVQEDKRMKHTSDLGPSNNDLEDKEYNHSQVDTIELVELRDVQTGKVLVFPRHQGDQALLFEDDFLQHSNVSPLKLNTFNPDPESIWGVPDSAILMPQQIEINEIRTQRMKHRRISLVKILYENGAITEANLTKLLSADVAAGVEVNDLLGIELNQMVSDIPTSLHVEEEAVMGDVREQQGMSRNQFGEFSRGGDTTATEATIVRMASELRVDERRDILSDMLVDLMEDVNRVVFNLWGNEQVVDVVGPAGMRIYVSFRPLLLRGTTLELKIDPDTSVPETKDIRRQNAFELYGAFRDNPLVDPYMLTQYTLQEIGKPQFEAMLHRLDLGQGGMSPGNPLTLTDFARVVNGTQQNRQVPQSVPASNQALLGGLTRATL